MAPALFTELTGTLVSCSPPSLHTYSLFFLFRWFHLGLTVVVTTAAMGRLAWVLLIRTFLWLSVDCCLSRGWPPACSVLTGTLVSRARHRPLHTYSWLSLISVVSSGADCCDYGGYGPPCVGAFDPNFPLAFVELLPLAGMAPACSLTGTLVRVLATVPPHLLLAFLISVVSSGADCWL